MAFVRKKKLPGILPFLVGVLLAGLCSFSGFAQEAHPPLVTVSVTGKTLKEIFREMEQQTGWTINFQDKVLDASRKTDFQVKDLPVHTALRQLLAGEPVEVIVKGNMLVIAPRPAPRKEPVKKEHPSVTLKGRIVDFESYQPLPGATVTIQETGQTVLSDEKGYYTFTDIPAGHYSLTASYTGYQKNWVAGVDAVAGQELTNDIKMQAGKSLGEVVVQGGARKVKAVTHTTEKELITEIRTATGILSGVSSEMISKTADRNAADVVKRIPGITVVDNRLIVVRGMNERYNLTYLNDNIAPATELNSKAFAYDLLPSSIIDRIIVYKSPRADLNGEFTGAAVKVYTRNAMPVRHFDIGVQMALRPGSTLSNINAYNGGKTDWLGIDDGTRKLPGFSPGYFQTDKSAGNISNAKMLAAFSPVLSYRQEQSTPDMQVYANYYNSFRVGRKARLFDLTSVTFTRETTMYDIYKQSGNTDATQADGKDLNLGTANRINHSSQSTVIGKFNVLENLHLRLDPDNSIQFKNFLVNDGRSLTAINDGRNNELPRYDAVKEHTKDIILSFQQRLLYAGNLGGKHKWGKAHAQQLEWNLGYTYDLQNVPDQRVAHFSTILNHTGDFEAPGLNYFSTGTNGGDGTYGMISRLYIRQRENNYNASADYSWTLNPSLRLHAGTFQLFKSREVHRRIFLVNRGGLTGGMVADPLAGQGGISNGWNVGHGANNPDLVFFRLQDLSRVWSSAWFPEDQSGLGLYEATSPVDSYVATEQNNAFYGMGDLQTKDQRFSLNGGLRVEYDQQKIAGAQLVSGLLNLVYARHPKTAVLPSVNFTWRPDSVFVGRLSYGRSINRPEFREITPYIDYDYANKELTRGNAELLSATIDNYDFRLEYYPRNRAGNEMIDIGAFYKKLKNPIERLRMDKSGYIEAPFSQIYFANAYDAEIFGVEAEIKKNLSFLGGGLMRRLNIVLNGTWTQSRTHQYDESTVGRINKNVVLKGRPLQGQAPYMLNGGLFYEHPGLGTKLGLTYNVSGPVIYAKSIYNSASPGQRADSNEMKAIRPDLLQLPMQLLDLSYSQRIVRSLQAKLSVQNLLDQAYRIVEDQNYDQQFNPEKPVTNRLGEVYYKGDNIYTKYKPGRYFLLSLTYSF